MEHGSLILMVGFPQLQLLKLTSLFLKFVVACHLKLPHKSLVCNILLKLQIQKRYLGYDYIVIILNSF